MDEETRVRLTDAEWRTFQAIPEQGYSHRHWVDHKIEQRVAAEAKLHEGQALEAYEKGHRDALNEPITDALVRAATDAFDSAWDVQTENWEAEGAFLLDPATMRLNRENLIRIALEAARRAQ